MRSLAPYNMATAVTELAARAMKAFQAAGAGCLPRDPPVHPEPLHSASTLSTERYSTCRGFCGWPARGHGHRHGHRRLIVSRVVAIAADGPHPGAVPPPRVPLAQLCSETGSARGSQQAVASRAAVQYRSDGFAVARRDNTNAAVAQLVELLFGRRSTAPSASTGIARTVVRARRVVLCAGRARRPEYRR